MSLLSATTQALKEIGEFDVPTSLVGNDDPTAVQLRALADRAARHLGRDYSWQELEKDHSFSTVASTANYDLPSDFARFADQTVWDTDGERRLLGPIPSRLWQLYQRGLALPVGINKVLRVKGDDLYIHPTPTSAYTVEFTYYRSTFISSPATTGDVDSFGDDTDTVYFPEDLLTLSIKWRFLAAKGEAYEAELAEFQRRLDTELVAQRGAPMLNFNERQAVQENIPETGWTDLA